VALVSILADVLSYGLVDLKAWLNSRICDSTFDPNHRELRCVGGFAFGSKRSRVIIVRTLNQWSG
jgi:hypothetical protein